MVGIPGTVITEQPVAIGGYAYEPDDETISLLKSTLFERGASSVSISQVEEEEWSESWKQFFKPRRIGKRFWVRPTWEESEAQPGDLEIVLDPGQAFGTGDHPTTRMCLELLENAVSPGDAIADVGCGSGILSVGACLLGAGSVIASDIDKASVESAEENATRNNVKYTALEGKGFQVYEPSAVFDGVVSNIISAALIALAPEAHQRVKPGGWWIVSGIIQDNWPDVLATAQSVGFALDERLEEDQWVAARFRR